MGESGRRVLEDSVLELPLGSCSVPLEGTTGEEETQNTKQAPGSELSAQNMKQGSNSQTVRS